MRDTKLTNLLGRLTPGEFRDFEKFIVSPFFSKGRDLYPFFKILKPFYPDFKSEKFNNEFIFQKLFSGKKYDKVRSDNLIKTLSSQLFLHCKNFLIQIDFQEDESRKTYYLLNQLRKKKLYTEFDKDFKKHQSENRDAFKGGVRGFIEKYFLEISNRDNNLDRNEFVKSYEANLKAGEYSLLTGLISSFRYLDELSIAKVYNLNVRNNIISCFMDNFDADKFYEIVKKNNLELYPYVEVYYLFYKMNKHSDIDTYIQLKEILRQRFELFSQIENYTLWNMMHSFCNVQDFPNEEFFFIYNHIIENGIYKKSSDEDFHIVLFRNIVNMSASIDKLEWLENFIDKYSHELHSDQQNDMRNYSLAVLNLAKENYSEALSFIQKISMELFLYKIDIRFLLLRLYYKMEYYDQVFSTIDSSLHFLKTSEEFSDLQKQSMKNFIRYLKELIKLKFSGGSISSEIDFLKQNIISEKYLSQRMWLLKEADNLVIR